MKFLSQLILLITLSAVTVADLQSQTYWEKAGKMSEKVNVLYVRGNGTLYAGTDGTGLLASTDEGTTWEQVDDDTDPRRTTILSITENSFGELVVGTDRGIWFYTSDPDSPIDFSGSLQKDTDVTSILALDDDSYLIGTDDGIFLSVNRSDSWLSSNRGLNECPQTYALFLSRNLIFVGLDCGIYYTAGSIDTDPEWESVGVSGNAFAIDGFDNGIILAGVDNKIKMTSVEEGGGLNWGDAPVQPPIGEDDLRSICVTDLGTVFAATRSEGVFSAEDNGRSSWAEFNNGLDADVLINSMTKAPNGILYLATDNGVYRTRRSQTEIIEPYLSLGDAVVTCNDNTGAANNYVLGILKVRNAEIQPRNENWQPPIYHHPTWTSDILGDVFSTCIDIEGAIYVAATSIYPGDADVGIGGAGAVYKIEAITNEVSVYIGTLDASVYDPGENAIPNTGPGLGSIAYDVYNDQFFVSNFEDGCIYRIKDDPDNPGRGKIEQKYDPLEPDNSVSGHAPKGQLIWGLGVIEGMLFYSVWSEDEFESFNLKATRSNSIRSVALLPDGAIDGSTDERKIDMAEHGLDNGNFTSPVSDIEFNIAGDEMLLAERSMRGFKSNAHKSRILRFVEAGNGRWQKSEAEYNAGTISTNNAAGGCDFGYLAMDTSDNFVDCDSRVWFSADAFRASWEGREADGNIYGYVRMPLGGGENRDAVVIDADGDTTSNVAKRDLGDIDIYTARCGTFQLFSCDDISRDTVINSSSTDPDNPECCWDLLFSMNRPEDLRRMRLRVLSPGIRFSEGGVDVSEWGVASLDDDAVVYNILPNPEVTAGEQNRVRFCLETDQDIDATQFIEVQWFGVGGSPCHDTIEVDCLPGRRGRNCGELVEKPVAKCVSFFGGASRHSFSITVTNNSGSPIRTIHLRPPNGFAIANIFPRDIVLESTLDTGASYTTGPIDIHGINLDRDTSLVMRFAISTEREDYCCTFEDTLRFETCLSCCLSSPIRVAPSSPLERVNGQVALQVPLRRNSRPITQMTATVVSAMINSCTLPQRWTPVGGNIVRAPEQWGGLPRVDLPRPESQLPAGLTFDNGQAIQTRFDCVSYGYVPRGTRPNEPLVLRLEFPQVAGAAGCSEDTLYFAMRYQFTDVNCVSCDTLVWYHLARHGSIFDDPLLVGPPLVTGTSKLKAADVIQGGQGLGPDAGFASLFMQDNNSGVLTLRTGDASNITIDGFRFETDQNIEIASFVSPGQVCSDIEFLGYRATVGCGSLEEGAHQFNIRFVRRDADAFNCKLFVQLSYNDSLIGEGGPDVVEKEFSVILDPEKKDKFSDSVSTEEVDKARILFFTLKLDNRNEFKEPIHYARISLSEGAKILAVGPGVDDSCVVTRVFKDEKSEYLVPWTPNLRRAGLNPGDSIVPIYLAVSVTDSTVRTVSVLYQTLDENQSVISEVSSEFVNPETVTTVKQEDFRETPAYTVNDFGLNLRPNPADNSVAVTFELDQYRHNVSLTIVDMSGRTVSEVWTRRSLSGGLHEFQVETGQLPAGSYRVNLQVGGSRSSRALSVVR